MNRLALRGASGLKCPGLQTVCRTVKSRPARGEWIEIFTAAANSSGVMVSPREGRVD